MLLFKLAISIQTATVGAAVDAGDLNMPSKRTKLRGLTLNTEVKVLESELSFREREQWSSLTRDLNSIRYYVTPSTGMCSPVDAFTPAWITSFYSDYTTCCKSGWAVEACLAKAPPGNTQPVPTTKPTLPQILYYPISSTGMCAPVDAYTPRWMTATDFYSDYVDCCKSSWNVEPCLAAQPPGRPTSSPTSEPTSQPTASFESTSHPSPRASQESSSEHSAAHTTFSPSHEPASETNPSVFTSVPTRNTISPNSNSSCNASLWHISDDFLKCTNSFGYPVIWDSPSLSSAYLHETLSGCCEKFFGIHGSNCAFEDICASSMSSGPTFQPTLKTNTTTTSEPTALPTTPSPATSSASSGNSFSCSSNKWHPDVINEDGCSNSLDFPEEWLGEAIYFYSSSNECCVTFFGDNECMVYDECDDGTPTTSETTSTIPQTTKTDAPHNTAATPETTTVASESTESPDITHDTTESTAATEPTTTEAPKVTSETATFPTTSSTSTSHSPTISLAPTGKSFPCSSNQWHPDMTAKDGCSNSLHFPEEWLGQPMFFFNNSKDCCDLFLRDRSCKVYDVCENGTLSSPLLTPTQSPLPKEIQSSCPSASWHPSEDYSKCTNSFGYPEIWGSPTLISVYLFETAEHCCAVFFEARNEKCVIEDICGDKLFDDTGTISGETKTTSTSTTTPPVTTSGRACDFNTPWHPSSDFTRCTNSDEYPESWILPNMREKYLFDSKERCCEVFFVVQDKNCVAEDACLGTFTNIDPLTKTPSSRPTDYQATSGPTRTEPVSATDGACYSNTWHPSSDFTRCTNSNEYPESWNLPGMRQEYLYDSKERCCEVFFLLQDRSCVLEDSCLGVFTSIEPETETPTKIPTENPNTHSSSENSTSPPQWPMTPLISSAPMSSEPSSLMPANSPSYSPSSHPSEVKWYPDRNPDYSKGRCINAVPIPQYRETYASLRECCDRSFAGQESGVCLSSEATTTSSSSVSHTDPKNAIGSSTAQTNSTSAAVQYYSDPSSGMCAVVDKSTPSWIQMFFTDWTECCKIGWVLDACLAAAPHAL